MRPFKIKNTNPAPEQEPLVWSLNRHPSGDILLNCEEFNVIRIDAETGKLHVGRWVSADLGLPLDDEGRILLDER